MLLFVLFAALSVAVVAVLVRPLLGRVEVADGTAEDVYARQLAELDADVARGAVTAADADAARAEIARRLLRAHRSGAPAAGVRKPRLVAALALVVFVPAFALGGYLLVGAPHYPDQSLATLRAPDDAVLDGLAGEAEARLEANPSDGAALETRALIDLQRGRFDAAANAFGAAVAALGERADLLAGQARALTLAANGTVTDPARALFDRAAALEPEAEMPQVFLAIAARQRGDLKDAAARWRTLIAGSTGTEPWLPLAGAEIRQIAAASGYDGALPHPGIAAAEAPPAGQSAMIEGMVAGLAARLRESGGSAEEWARLVRSYRVLGREEDARQAAADALKALPEADRTAFAATDGIADLVR